MKNRVLTCCGIFLLCLLKDMLTKLRTHTNLNMLSLNLNLDVMKQTSGWEMGEISLYWSYLHVGLLVVCVPLCVKVLLQC